jgi:PIN domain-containing protein
MLPDPNDEMVLETAINGRADAIVTFNERHFRPVAARFRFRWFGPGKSSPKRPYRELWLEVGSPFAAASKGHMIIQCGPIGILLCK